jgi:REP element-mobilizing transposase RayT
MSLYKNKFRVESSRLKDWDYSTPWWYYITICTNNMKCWFGKIKKGKIQCSDLGSVATKYYIEIPPHFKHSSIDYFTIMQNHIQGIIIIEDHVETRHGVSLRSEFGNVNKHSLSTIVNHYKGAVTRYAKKNKLNNFSWQQRFYDHIIRNENDLHRIRTYIQNNPLKWELDEYYYNE